MAKISGFHCLLDKFKHRQFMGDTRNPWCVPGPTLLLPHCSASLTTWFPSYGLRSMLLFPLSLLLSSRLKEQSGYAVRDFEQKSRLEVANRGAGMEIKKPAMIILRLNSFLQECHENDACPQHIISGTTGCHFIPLLITSLIIWLRKCHLASLFYCQVFIFPFVISILGKDTLGLCRCLRLHYAFTHLFQHPLIVFA